jgi:hypothetical protein
MNRQHDRITRTTLPERPLYWWVGNAIGFALVGYLAAVTWVNMTSIPTGWMP